MKPTVVLALALGSVGCGLGFTNDPPGGATDLPTLGAGPYGKPELDFDTPADEPFVVVPRTGSFLDPAVLRRDDGGFRFWFSRLPDNIFDESEIWRAELPDILELVDVEPTVAMVADQDWEQGWVAAPAIVELADGTMVMYYEGGLSDRAIGRAESSDGGATWRKDAGPILVDAAEPTVARVGDTGDWLMYFTRPGAVGIFRASSTDGVAFVADSEPVIVPRVTLRDAFDKGGVSDPYLLIEETAADRLHYGLFYNGSDGDPDEPDLAIGFAGSFDGIGWERYGGLEPVLTPGSPSEHGPAAIIEAARGFLFYDQRGSGRQRIAVALHP